MGYRPKPRLAPLPRIDFDSIAERADLPSIVQAAGIRLDRNSKGMCPFHENSETEALSVYRKNGMGRWRWKCHADGGACGGGDAIDFVAQFDGITRVEAAKKLGGSECYLPSGEFTPRPKAERPAEAEPWRNVVWQSEVDKLIRNAVGYLWNAMGRAALGWLRDRGLSEDTIRTFQLGYMPDSYRGNVLVPGIGDDGGPANLWCPRGIIIPWLAPGGRFDDVVMADPMHRPRWIAVKVRRLRPRDDSGVIPVEPPENGPKYSSVGGTATGILYPAPEISRDRAGGPALIVEGEFDALIGHQAVGHLMPVVTSGSASTARNLFPSSRESLLRSSHLLLAHDRDKAGANAAEVWKELFGREMCRRVRVPGKRKDLTDFIQSGGNAEAWVRKEIAKAERASLEEYPTPEPSVAEPAEVRSDSSADEPTTTDPNTPSDPTPPVPDLPSEPDAVPDLPAEVVAELLTEPEPSVEQSTPEPDQPAAAPEDDEDPLADPFAALLGGPSRPTPWRAVVRCWPMDAREAWGRLAGELQDTGQGMIDWHDAELIAFEQMNGGPIRPDQLVTARRQAAKDLERELEEEARFGEPDFDAAFTVASFREAVENESRRSAEVESRRSSARSAKSSAPGLFGDAAAGKPTGTAKRGAS